MIMFLMLVFAGGLFGALIRRGSSTPR